MLEFHRIGLDFFVSVTEACVRRPGAVASVSRRRRERRTLLAGGGRRASAATRLRQAMPLSACIRISGIEKQLVYTYYCGSPPGAVSAVAASPHVPRASPVKVAILAISVLQTLSKIAVHMYDVKCNGAWEARSAFTFYLEFVFDTMQLLVTLAHYIHIWALTGYARVCTSPLVCLRL